MNGWNSLDDCYGVVERFGMMAIERGMQATMSPKEGKVAYKPAWERYVNTPQFGTHPPKLPDHESERRTQFYKYCNLFQFEVERIVGRTLRVWHPGTESETRPPENPPRRPDVSAAEKRPEAPAVGTEPPEIVHEAATPDPAPSLVDDSPAAPSKREPPKKNQAIALRSHL